MDFGEILTEYFSQFRGQGTSIPAYGDREYTLAISLGNSAIRTWDRVDGQLWRELIVTAGVQTTANWATANRTLDAVTKAAPLNMRKPPAFVRFSNGSSYFDIYTIPPQEAMDRSSVASDVWFTGGANEGYTMNVGTTLLSQYNGWTIDYVFIKKPTLLLHTANQNSVIPEMSDPEFMVQKMIELRARPARNGFLYKTASADAKTALLNMKIENDSGVWGNSDKMRDLLTQGQGWGVNSPIGDIRLNN